jgi:hypothetical protein
MILTAFEGNGACANATAHADNASAVSKVRKYRFIIALFFPADAARAAIAA